MANTINENAIEELGLELLADLGYAIAHGPDIAPEGPHPERLSYGDVVLLGRLKASLSRINPHLSPDVAPDIIDEVIRKLQQQETPALEEENRRLHLFMVDGVDVEVTREDGSSGWPRDTAQGHARTAHAAGGRFRQAAIPGLHARLRGV